MDFVWDSKIKPIVKPLRPLSYTPHNQYLAAYINVDYLNHYEI